MLDVRAGDLLLMRRRMMLCVGIAIAVLPGGLRRCLRSHGERLIAFPFLLYDRFLGIVKPWYVIPGSHGCVYVYRSRDPSVGLTIHNSAS